MVLHSGYKVLYKLKRNWKRALEGKTFRGFLYARKEVMRLPRKPKRPCSYPGCPKLTEGQFCEEHQKLTDRNYEKYQRDPALKKRYGRSWKRIRDRYIAEHPLCEQCEKNGRITPAQEVHHIQPLSRGGTNEYGNLMALCTSCHSEITAREGGRWGR